MIIYKLSDGRYLNLDYFVEAKYTPRTMKDKATEETPSTLYLSFAVVRPLSSGSGEMYGVTVTGKDADNLNDFLHRSRLT